MNDNLELNGDTDTVAILDAANNGLPYPRTNTGDSEAAYAEDAPFEGGTFIAEDGADHVVER